MLKCFCAVELENLLKFFAYAFFATFSSPAKTFDVYRVGHWSEKRGNCLLSRCPTPLREVS